MLLDMDLMRTLSDMADNMPILPSPFFVILPDSHCTALHCYATVGMLGCWDAPLHCHMTVGMLGCMLDLFLVILSDALGDGPCQIRPYYTALHCHATVGMLGCTLIRWLAQISGVASTCPRHPSIYLAHQTTPQDALPFRPPLKMPCPSDHPSRWSSLDPFFLPIIHFPLLKSVVSTQDLVDEEDGQP